MKFGKEEQQDSDLEWFAIDKKGRIICFTSGGSVFPDSASFSKEDWEKLIEYFESLPFNKGEFILGQHPLVQKPIAPPALVGDPTFTATTGRFWKDMAKRGLFAFDYNRDAYREIPKYHLVAAPKIPLHVSDLPETIATIVQRTVYQGDVIGKEWISFDEVW
jgi:hypothetical protein